MGLGNPHLHLGEGLGQPILGVALISALYAAAVLIIWKILGRYFRVSPVCPVFMALLPLGMEGAARTEARTGGPFPPPTSPVRR